MSKQRLLIVAALVAIPSSLTAANIIDVNFESGLGNLYSGGTATQSANSGAGTGNPASFGVNSGNHGALVLSTTRAIDAEISFSVDAKWKAPSKDGRQGLAVGWSKVSTLNTYTGTGYTGIGIRHTSANQVTFSYGAGTDPNQSYALGASTATMEVGDWYRFSGSILYDGTAGKFTFTNLVLANIGADGTGDVTPGTATTVLSGSFTDGYAFQSGWLTADTSASRVFLLSGGEPGIQSIDNFSVTVIPEPSAALLGGLGMLALLRRRRA